MANRIDIKLNRAKKSGQFVLAPFLTVGFPTVSTSIEIASEIIEAGADLLELGIPFSDPLAEGPTIQRSSLRSLQSGVNFGTCLEVARKVRQANSEVPLILMGYYNTLMKFGLSKAVNQAVDAGVDGFIVADLPIEESTIFAEICFENELHLVPLLAPTSTDERIKKACSQAGGFIYCVSVTGVTGARSDLNSGVAQLVSRIRSYTDLPILVGFGVSTPQHVREISQFADGAVFGSALIDVMEKNENNVEAASNFVSDMKKATLL